jgi:hypothetical protein
MTGHHDSQHSARRGAEGAVESSGPVDRQAAHWGCGQQAAYTDPTTPQPDYEVEERTKNDVRDYATTINKEVIIEGTK